LLACGEYPEFILLKGGLKIVPGFIGYSSKLPGVSTVLGCLRWGKANGITAKLTALQ